MGCGGSKADIKSDTKLGSQLGIIISGAPASGKGTQCEMIVKQYGVVHISTGDILRQHIKDNTELGKQAKKYIEDGHLVPDELIINLVKARVSEKDCRERGWLLDGFPRTRAQADAIIQAGVVPNKFVYLSVHDDVLIERVVGRRLDPETGHIYHLKFNPPPPEIEDRLVHRPDDTEEAARTRLAEFHKNNNEILAAYDDVIHKFNGAKPSEEIAYEITKYLDDPMSERYWYDSVIGTPAAATPTGGSCLDIPGLVDKEGVTNDNDNEAKVEADVEVEKQGEWKEAEKDEDEEVTMETVPSGQE
ncbi:Adenylate kinase/UMP-CMP kinase [Carpediemonas membranifera]|uniref:Adenylate kinase/UMP-CMP kinase n=1 Tax=Carpediemonas membranifera TaxID=201153 RepID=A0A8J6ASM0_9EUKA|nr:Adenylate kinase/UMP-CMP kinase [Carpediemonas membranifera]|eukprot:KAG9391325.1 Adenylate kinase/UMP-CMP kinase [Carpediemonas membranifera]